MAELWFYHLERAGLERVLPELLEKTLQRGWRALVQVGARERLDALNTQLWTYRDDAFLPHGTADEDLAAEEPVLLTLSGANVNRADVLVLTEPPAEPLAAGRAQGFARVILIFDGHDAGALQAARMQWTAAKAAGLDVAYWQQSAAGRWEKKG